MTTPSNLTEEYIFAHDLRPASAKIYRASTKALLSISERPQLRRSIIVRF